MGHEVLGSVFDQGETKDSDVKNVAELNEIRQQENSLNNGSVYVVFVMSGHHSKYFKFNNLFNSWRNN